MVADSPLKDADGHADIQGPCFCISQNHILSSRFSII